MSPRIAAVAAAAALLLAAPRAEAYNTLKSRNGSDSRWPAGAMPVTWFVHQAGTPDVPLAELQLALRTAAQAWVDVGCSGLRFEYGGATPRRGARDADDRFQVEFEEDVWDATIGADAAAVAPTFRTRGGEIFEAGILFNGVDFTWSTDRSDNTSDIEGVAAHEFGHTLGLDHSREPAATMFFSGGDAGLRDLHADDERGVCYLYPTRAFTGGGPCDSCVNDSQCGRGAGDLCVRYEGGRFCGGACTQHSDCGEQYFCARLNDGTNQCAARNGACDQSGASIPFGEFCYGHETCMSGFCLAISDTAYCSAECNPSGADSCANGFRCVGEGTRGFCIRLGNQPRGSVCESNFDCASEICAPINDAAVCVEACNPQQAGAAPGGRECPENGTCVEAGDAPSDGLCFPAGEAAFGEACQSNLDCRSANCVNLGERAICSEDCNINRTDQCPAGSGCLPQQGNQGLCLPRGDRAIGDTCDSSVQCQGLSCVQVTDQRNECSQNCDPSGERGEPCPVGSACVESTGGGGLCIARGDGAFGDDCQGNADCASLTCIPLTETRTTCSEECDPNVTPSLCPEGAPCVELDDGSGICIPGGDVTEGGQCEVNIDCETGLVCLTSEDDEPGVCRKRCNGFTDEGCDRGFGCQSLRPGEGVCTPRNDGGRDGDSCSDNDPCEPEFLCIAVDTDQRSACFWDCNVETGDGCPPGVICLPLNPDFAPLGICLHGTRPLGDSCENFDQCEGGLCLRVSQTEAVCSRPCGDGADIAGCPDDMFCAELQDNSFACAPNDVVDPTGTPDPTGPRPTPGPTPSPDPGGGGNAGTNAGNGNGGNGGNGNGGGGGGGGGCASAEGVSPLALVALLALRRRRRRA